MSEKPVFEDHIGLVKSIVRSFDKSCRPEDSDFFSLACMAMMRAISSFDEDKSKFAYWATKIIRNAIVKEIKKNKLSLCQLSHDPISSDCQMPLELANFLSDSSESDTPSESENKRMLRRHYFEGVSMAEIARETGITREYVRQKLKKAIDSIRKKHKFLIENHSFWLSGFAG